MPTPTHPHPQEAGLPPTPSHPRFPGTAGCAILWRPRPNLTARTFSSRAFAQLPIITPGSKSRVLWSGLLWLARGIPVASSTFKSFPALGEGWACGAPRAFTRDEPRAWRGSERQQPASAGAS